MILLWGTRDYGDVESMAFPTAAGEGRPLASAAPRLSIVTRFFHIQLLPLFPLASYLILRDRGEERPIPLHRGSVVAGYLRTWGLLLLVVGVYEALHRGVGQQLGQGGQGAALFVLCALWMSLVFSLGRLSSLQRAQRQVYAEFAGAPVDVACLVSRGAVGAAQPLHEALRAEVVERARAYASSSYRDAADPHSAWDQIALSPAVVPTKDARFLRAALTLARLEGAVESGPRRQELARSHAALWRKLQDRASDSSAPGSTAADPSTAADAAA